MVHTNKKHMAWHNITMDKWDKMGAFSYIMASPDNSNTPKTSICNILYIRSKQTLE